MGLSWSRYARLALGCPSRVGEAGLEGEELEDMASFCVGGELGVNEMTISQGECPSGTCPGDLSRVQRAQTGYSTVVSPNLAGLMLLSVWCSTTGRPTVNVPNSGLECRGGTQWSVSSRPSITA